MVFVREAVRSTAHNTERVVMLSRALPPPLCLLLQIRPPLLHPLAQAGEVQKALTGLGQTLTMGQAEEFVHRYGSTVLSPNAKPSIPQAEFVGPDSSFACLFSFPPKSPSLQT